MNGNDLCRIEPRRSLMQNSLWHWDAYPELPDLEPYGETEMAHFTGPGLVRTIHLTLNIAGGLREELLRGVFLTVEYNALGYMSVHVPVGDFFCDSFESKSIQFAGRIMAKRPTNSLFCYLPMPFEKEIRITLRNTTDKKVTGYGYVTAETIPEWQPDLGYFHANWMHASVQLPDDTVPLLRTEGTGHFLGCHLTAVSSCPHFIRKEGICEGNDEFYVDGSAEPTAVYLGTEDFFGFSWNWQNTWYDDYAGTTYLDVADGTTKLACYRFLLNDPIRFEKSLVAQINYRHEIHDPYLMKAKSEGNGDVLFGTVSYWYQNPPISSG